MRSASWMLLAISLKCAIAYYRHGVPCEFPAAGRKYRRRPGKSRLLAVTSPVRSDSGLRGTMDRTGRSRLGRPGGVGRSGRFAGRAYRT